MIVNNKKNNWFEISQQLIDLLSSEAYVKNISGKYLLANKNYLQRLFRLGLIESKNEVIIGRTDYDIFDPISADKFLANDRLVIEENRKIYLEEDVGGSNIPNQKIISIKHPLYGNHEEIIGIIGQSYEYAEFKYKNISTYLTHRETQVLACKYLGFSTKKIANLLDMSHRTTEGHWNTIKSKLKVVSRDNLIELINSVGWSDLLKQIYHIVLHKEK